MVKWEYKADRNKQTSAFLCLQLVNLQDKSFAANVSDTTGEERGYTHLPEQLLLLHRQCPEGKQRGCTARFVVVVFVVSFFSPRTPTWNRGAEGYEHHSSDRVFQTDGAAEMGRQVARHSCQDADEGNGDKEAGPAVPVFSGRDESKEDFPENCQEVHDVIEAGRQAFFSAFLLVIITW